MPVKLTMNSNWQKVVKGDFTKEGLFELANDVHRRAVILAPIDTSALRNSGVVEPITDGYRIKFGSGRVPYARRRHFENKKNPATREYLSKAGDSVARGDKSKYFRGKI